jgi:hypothetical protein
MWGDSLEISLSYETNTKHYVHNMTILVLGSGEEMLCRLLQLRTMWLHTSWTGVMSIWAYTVSGRMHLSDDTHVRNSFNFHTPIVFTIVDWETCVCTKRVTSASWYKCWWEIISQHQRLHWCLQCRINNLHRTNRRVFLYASKSHDALEQSRMKANVLKISLWPVENKAVHCR